MIGRNLSLAYREPVEVVRGWMQYLFDDEAAATSTRTTTCRTSATAHPRVVDAGASGRWRVLNTNTRYLNDLLDRVRRSGSRRRCRAPLRRLLLRELGERGQRARAAARARLTRPARPDRARGGVPRQHDDAHRHQPVQARGPRRHRRAGLGARRAGARRLSRRRSSATTRTRREVRDAGRRDRRRVARAEGAASPPSSPRPARASAGRSSPPPGYLAEACTQRVRAAGGVCIADEVQTGLGRMGTHFWAFEAQGVVPDIVVMGKPLGNGHPIGAVVTTREIADFVRQRHGVLQHVRRQHRLVRRSGWPCSTCCATKSCRRTRCASASGCWSDCDRSSARTRSSATSAGRDSSSAWSSCATARHSSRRRAEASFVANRMREKGILLGTDGPHHNVVKIRPPMPFDVDDAELLVEAFDVSLGELA